MLVRPSEILSLAECDNQQALPVDAGTNTKEVLEVCAAFITYLTCAGCGYAVTAANQCSVCIATEHWSENSNCVAAQRFITRTITSYKLDELVQATKSTFHGILMAIQGIASGNSGNSDEHKDLVCPK